MNTVHHDAAIHHDATIQDQFTRQAEPFVERHGRGKDALLDAMAACGEFRAEDTLLDVACGPGIVSCYLAQRVHHVTGLDVVPAMLERARRLQTERGVPNATWSPGLSTELPFTAGSFEGVVTRFSLHHFLEPAAALREMKRVAKPGGTIVVCDVAPDPETQERFDHWEKLRDPSHTQALTAAEMEALGEAAGLSLHAKQMCMLEMDLENLLAGSFPKDGDAERIRALFAEEIQAGTDMLGVAARRKDGAVQIAYPVAVFAWHNCD